MLIVWNPDWPWYSGWRRLCTCCGESVAPRPPTRSRPRPAKITSIIENTVSPGYWKCNLPIMARSVLPWLVGRSICLKFQKKRREVTHSCKHSLKHVLKQEATSTDSFVRYLAERSSEYLIFILSTILCLNNAKERRQKWKKKTQRAKIAATLPSARTPPSPPKKLQNSKRNQTFHK